MANSLTKLQAFFYKVGSLDFPFNYDTSERFGFDQPNGPAVFTSTINELKQYGFNNDRLYNLTTIVDPKDPATMNNLICETFENDAVKEQDVTSEEWSYIWTILEALYDRQASCRNESEFPDGFASYADALLGSPIDPEDPDGLATNPYYTSNYQVGSITLGPPTINRENRLNDATFRATINGIVCYFTILYDPDAYISRYSTMSIQAYGYVNDADRLISSTEFSNSSAEMVALCSAKGCNLNIAPALATHTEYDDTGTTKLGDVVFNIYTNKSTNTGLSVGEKDIACREFLMYKFNNDIVLLQKKFPSLFSKSEVDVIPFYDNIMLRPDGSQLIKQVIDGVQLRDKLLQYQYTNNPDDGNYKPFEVLTMGQAYLQEASANQYTNYTIVAVLSKDGGGSMLPITGPFPDYEAKSFDTTNAPGPLSEADNFQYNLMRTILHIKGVLEWDDLIEFEPGIGWTRYYEADGVTPSAVSFTAKEIKYVVVYPTNN